MLVLVRHRATKHGLAIKFQKEMLDDLFWLKTSLALFNAT